MKNKLGKNWVNGRSRHFLITLIGVLLTLLNQNSLACGREQDTPPSLDCPEVSITPWKVPIDQNGDRVKLADKFADVRTRHRRLADSYCSVFLDKNLTDRYCPDFPKLKGTGSTEQQEPPPLSGASWETAFAYGIADFLAVRAKAELRQWVVSGAITDLCSRDSVKTSLFPDTCVLQRQYEYGAPATDAMLVKTFRKDLQVLPARYLWSSEQSRPTWGFVLTNYYRELRIGEKAINIAAGLAEVSTLKESCVSGTAINTSCALLWSGMLARAYLWSKTGDDEQAEEISPEQFLAAILVVLNENKMDVYLNGLEETFVSLQSNKVELTKFTGQLRGKVQSLVVAHRELLRESERLQQLLEKNAGVDEQRASALRLTEKATIILTRSLLINSTIVDWCKSCGPSEVVNTAKVRAHQIEIIASIVGSFSAGSYSDGFSAMLLILNCMADETENNQCEGWPKLSSENKVPIVAISKNLPLIIALADAKSASDIEVALDAAAAPVGAWRYKRLHSMNSLTGLVGGNLSWERLSGDGVSDYDGWSFGLFAPVGIDRSWPTANQKGSNGFLVSIIDVGGLVTTRITGDSNSDVATTEDPVRLKNILSFGLFYHWSIENSPIVTTVR